MLVQCTNSTARWLYKFTRKIFCWHRGLNPQPVPQCSSRRALQVVTLHPRIVKYKREHSDCLITTASCASLLIFFIALTPGCCVDLMEDLETLQLLRSKHWIPDICWNDDLIDNLLRGCHSSSTDSKYFWKAYLNIFDRWPVHKCDFKSIFIRLIWPALASVSGWQCPHNQFRNTLERKEEEREEKKSHN